MSYFPDADEYEEQLQEHRVASALSDLERRLGRDLTVFEVEAEMDEMGRRIGNGGDYNAGAGIVGSAIADLERDEGRPLTGNERLAIEKSILDQLSRQQAPDAYAAYHGELYRDGNAPDLDNENDRIKYVMARVTRPDAAGH